MTKILLLSYKKEYQNTDISVDDLCSKYNIVKSDLKGYTKWTKDTVEEHLDITIVSEDEDIISCPANSTEPLDITIVSEDDRTPSDAIVTSTQKEILEDIDTFKKKAVKECLRFIKDDARYAEVKEFKDMVAIIDSIEKSYKDTKDPEGTTINVLIQNLTQKFKDTPDDC